MPAGDAADLQEAGMERQVALMQRGLLSEVPEDVRRLQQLNGRAPEAHGVMLLSPGVHFANGTHIRSQ